MTSEYKHIELLFIAYCRLIWLFRVFGIGNDTFLAKNDKTYVWYSQKDEAGNDFPNDKFIMGIGIEEDSQIYYMISNEYLPIVLSPQSIGVSYATCPKLHNLDSEDILKRIKSTLI